MSFGDSIVITEPRYYVVLTSAWAQQVPSEEVAAGARLRQRRLRHVHELVLVGLVVHHSALGDVHAEEPMVQVKVDHIWVRRTHG